MTIEQTIKKAIEGGYNGIFTDSEKIQDQVTAIKDSLLDPKFWKALGKGLGYKDSYSTNDPEWKVMIFGEMEKRNWRTLFRNFTEHLIKGESIETFFEEF